MPLRWRHDVELLRPPRAQEVPRVSEVLSVALQRFNITFLPPARCLRHDMKSERRRGVRVKE